MRKQGVLAGVQAAMVLGLLLVAGEAAAKGCMSNGCHQELTKLRYMHGPVAAEMAGAQGCVMCHVPAGPACAARRAGIFKPKAKNICFSCHDKGTGTQHTQAYTEAKCLQCHSPHGSNDSPQLLRAGRKRLPDK